MKVFKLRTKNNTTHSWCTDCLNKQKKKHYNENKKYYTDKTKRRRKELRDYINSFKKECVICGYDKTHWALDFHHKDASKKEIEIAKLACRGWSKERIKKEIDKCIIVCRNCHVEIHAPIA